MQRPTLPVRATAFVFARPAIVEISNSSASVGM